MSLNLLLDMAVSMTPDRVAVGDLTFAELQARVGASAALLVESGAGSVAYLGQSGPAFHIALFAAARAGLVFAPLNFRLARGQLQDLLAQLPDPLVVVDDRYADDVAEQPRTWSSASLLQAAGPGPERPAPDGGPAVLLFTSGTTAAPKGVLLRHSHLLSYVLETVELGSAGEDEMTLVSVPPYHIAGVGSVLTNTYAGRRVAHLPEFSPEAWLDVVRSQQVTSAMVVPTMLARVVQSLEGGPASVPSLRSLAYGGGRMPAPVIEAALRAFPETAFVNAYGLTETSSTIALLDDADHRASLLSDDPAVRPRLSSVGRLLPGVEGQVRDPEGLVLPVGEVGELYVRGPQVSGEYLGTGARLDPEGWFPTRDLARLDAAGYLFLEGRSDDVIIRGGENIAPAEVEDVLLRHPDVGEVVVIGVPDAEWGERLVAVVVPATARAPEPQTLRDFVRERLRGSRTPDEVVFRGELPVTATGKVLRRVLVAELGSGSQGKLSKVDGPTGADLPCCLDP